MFESELNQETVWSVASAGVTVAINVSDLPLVNAREVRLSLMEETAMGFWLTVTTQDADFPPAKALIVALPTAIAVTKPRSETVATDSLVDDHMIL